MEHTERMIIDDTEMKNQTTTDNNDNKEASKTHPIIDSE